MTIHSIECVDCGETRIASGPRDELDPVLDECPECGETEYDVLT